MPSLSLSSRKGLNELLVRCYPGANSCSACENALSSLLEPKADTCWAAESSFSVVSTSVGNPEISQVQVQGQRAVVFHLFIGLWDLDS